MCLTQTRRRVNAHKNLTQGRLRFLFKYGIVLLGVKKRKVAQTIFTVRKRVWRQIPLFDSI
jgi:hypothetical protein